MTSGATSPAPFGRRTGTATPPSSSTSWPVPVELVLHAANATSLMFLHRAREQGATFAPQALVWAIGARLVARIDFLVPVGPEKWCEQLVQLTPVLRENHP